jgi:hypothetical protein
MKKTMNLELLIGKKFTVNDPAIEYTCVGYAQNETFVVFGAANDVTNNRFTVRSFKVTEAKFIGQI